MSKVLSIIPAIISALASYRYYSSSGLQEEIQAGLIGFILICIVLPLSMIWFPNAYVNKTNWFLTRLAGQKTAILLFGWLLLLIPTIVMVVGVFRQI